MNHLHTHTISLGEDHIQIRLSKGFSSQLSEWSTPRHCNADYELHVLLDGSANMEVEEKFYSLSSSQAILIAPGKYHYPFVTAKSLRRFSISFTITGEQLLFQLQSVIDECYLFKVTPADLNLCETIYREYSTDTPYRTELLTALLSALIISMLRNVFQNKQNLPRHHTNRMMPEEESRIALIDAYFSTDYFQALHTAASPILKGEEALAKILHLSRRQLARVLKHYYGINFQQKLISARMDRAAWLLRTTDKRCDEIAALVGYSSESAFYQAFRSFFHSTPSQYRQSHL